jgi:phospholipase/carboxylesterase
MPTWLRSLLWWPRLTGTLDTLSAIARSMHPPRITALAGLIGDQDAALDEAVQRFRAAPLLPRLSSVRDQLGEAAGFTLSACAGLREAALTPGWLGGAFRALGHYTRAVEALYPLSAVLPAIGRWFLNLPQRDDAESLGRLRQRPAPGTGVRHTRNERGTRGGFSVYVPEYLAPIAAGFHPILMDISDPTRSVAHLSHRGERADHRLAARPGSGRYLR